MIKIDSFLFLSELLISSMCIMEEAYSRLLDAIMNEKKQVPYFPAFVSMQAQAWITQCAFWLGGPPGLPVTATWTYYSCQIHQLGGNINSF